jgi:hypothetical protein
LADGMAGYWLKRAALYANGCERHGDSDGRVAGRAIYTYDVCRR